MYIRVLGSAAGGGFPQWNCQCANCAGLRQGTIDAVPRTQSSIALSDDGEHWILCNTSPDIRAQLESTPELRRTDGKRGTAIGAIVLMDSQIDHTTGLLMLREGCPHEVWCTEMVHQDLCTGFPLFRILDHWNGGLRWNPIPLAGEFRIPCCPGLSLTPIPLRSAAPPYSPHRNDPHPGDNIGLLVEDANGKRLFYAPGLGQVDADLRGLMASADCLLVDGTFWREDEMRHAGVGTKPASEMGHLPQSGPGGMLELLASLPEPQRRILIHINNTTPILDHGSEERARVESQGVEVAYDGMAIRL